MSRMLAYIAAEPMPAAGALGEELLTEFGGLAWLHADGWGTAWRDPSTGAVKRSGSIHAPVGGRKWRQVLTVPSTARVIYLRFASRGAPPARQNVQPFVRGGIAFQHNGSIAPREPLIDFLTPSEREDLRGTTDSEAYFAVVRGRSGSMRGRDDEVGWAHGVARLRVRFPDACLNAMVLTPTSFSVIHASGRAEVPLHAFADRGVDLDALPPGHDRSYNLMRSTVSASGAQVVGTTGVDQRGWADLPDESMIAVSADCRGARSLKRSAASTLRTRPA